MSFLGYSSSCLIRLLRPNFVGICRLDYASQAFFQESKEKVPSLDIFNLFRVIHEPELELVFAANFEGLVRCF